MRVWLDWQMIVGGRFTVPQPAFLIKKIIFFIKKLHFNEKGQAADKKTVHANHCYA
jgi:hypothetical protein